MPIEYTSNPSTPATAQYMQQELAKATLAMRQMPSNSVSDFSEDEDDVESVATKTTPQHRSKQQSKKSFAGKGIGKRRTSVIHTTSPISLPSIEPRTPDDYFSMDSVCKQATFSFTNNYVIGSE